MLTLKRYTLLKDLVLLTIAMFIGSLGWAIFLLPNHITTGGHTRLGIHSLLGLEHSGASYFLGRKRPIVAHALRCWAGSSVLKRSMRL